MKTTQAAATLPNANPFPGLRPFDASEDHLFFGRDGQSEEILTSLRRNRFVAVVGTSGSGKSSLIRAGLLPLLHGGFMAKTGSTWRIAVLRPGNDPIGNLAHALTQDEVLGPRMEDPETSAIVMESSLRRSGLGLIEAVRLARIPEKENLLIVVDQFEELFRFMRSASGGHAEDDAAFVKLLIEATRQTEVPIFVVITMRSDFIGDCARFRELPETINRGLYLIPIMTRDQRREAITGPAAVAGTQIEPRLINRLLNDAGESPEQLPLLQHALMRTWAFWKSGLADGELDMESYEAIGGMEHALSRHADEAYDELPTQRSREIAEKIFKALAEKGPDNREVRRPTKVADLAGIANARPEEVISVIEAFRQPGRSFLMPPPEVELDEQTLIDISHESLIRGWRRLSDWVESEALSAAIYKRVAETAVLYDKGLAGLWHDPDLQVALGWQGKVNPTEAWGRRYHPGFPAAMNFLAESVAARDRELLQQEMRRVKELRRTRTFAAVLAVLLIMASALGVWAMTQTRKAKQQEARANNEAAKAVAAKDDAERAKAEEVIARKEAIRKKDEAEANKKIADQKTLEAQTNLVAAQEANRRAEENLAKAEAAAKEARKQEVIARNRYAQFRDAVNRENEQTQTNMGTIDRLSNELISFASPREAVRWRTIRANALTNIGQHKKAEEELTSALEIEPNNVDARMSRGYMYMLTDRIPQSIEDFDRIIAVDPNSSLAYLNKAISQGIVGDYNGASSSVKTAIDTYMPGTYSSLSENQVSEEIVAATGYQRITVDETSFQTALRYELANVEAFRGGDAFPAMLAAADRRPESKNAYLTAINWAWLQMNNSKDKNQDYGGWAAQGAIWERLGTDYCTVAAQAYRRFLAEDEKRHDSRYRNLADWTRKRAAVLNTTCQRAELVFPDTAQTLRQKAEVLISAEHNDEAEKALTQALALEPNNIDLLLRRAQVRNWLRKFPESKADAEAVIKLAGDRPVPKAEFYAGLASDERTRETNLRNVLKAYPTDSEALNFLAENLKESKPEESLELLGRATKLEPYADRLFFQKASLEQQTRRYREALQSIEAAIAIDNYNLSYYDKRASIEKDLSKSPAEIASNLVAGYNKVAELTLKRGDASEALDAYVNNLKTLAAAATGKDGETLHCDMVLTLHEIARLIEQQGASREKVIDHLKVMFGDVKGLEAVLKEELSRLGN